MNIMTPKEHELVRSVSVIALINEVEKTIKNSMSAGEFQCEHRFVKFPIPDIFKLFEKTIQKEFENKGWSLKIKFDATNGIVCFNWRPLEKDKFDDYCETNYGTKLS